MIKLKKALIVFSSLTFAVACAKAVTIGAGTGTLGLPGANNQVDTPSDGTSDQSRQNLDITFTSTLSAGTYQATGWTYQAGQNGSVIPYLAVSNGFGGYTIIAAGDTEVVSSFQGFTDVTVAFGGSDTFTLPASATVFAGIVNPTGAGSQNPIYTNLASGSFMDHDNNVDGLLSPGVLGGTVDGFGHGNLSRSYAFSVEVEQIPEPSSGLLALMGVGGLLFFNRRRRRG